MGRERKVLIWLLVMITLTPSGFDVAVLSAHDTIAECHVTATSSIHWDERMPINQEAVCMAADPEFAE